MNSTWTRNPITINWGCSDGESGCDPEFSGGTRTFSGGQTQKEFTIPAYTIKDNAGNVTNCPAKTVTIYHDSVAPDCPVYNEKTNWTNTPVTIEYGCSDSGSGCSTRSGYITYQEGVTYEQRLVPKTDCESYFDGKDWYEKCWTSMEYQNVAVPTNEIIKTAALPAYEVVDNVGNSRTCYPSGKTVNVYYDHKKPYLKAINDPRTWNRTAYNTLDNINVSDPDSGLATYYCNPGNSMDYGATGKQIVTCKAKDNAGNESKVKFWMYHEYQARYNPKTCSATQNCNCHTESWCPCDYHTVLVSADCGGENCFTMSTQWRSECGCDEQTGQRCDQCRYTYDCSYYDCPEGGTLGADHICRY